MLLQNANAAVPSVTIIIPGGANDPSCGNTCLIPQNITVPRGATVQWINKDLVPHTIVSGKPGDQNDGTLFDSGQIWMGESFMHDFNDVGTYNYFDRNHPWDAGIIRVTDDNKSLSEIMAEPVSTSVLESPLKQYKTGIAIQNIQCNQDLHLVIKAEDGTPACVKPDTANILIERGWAMVTSTCPTGSTMVNGQCVSSVPTTQVCNGDTLIPYSYALPCIRPTPTCPSGMTFSNGVCTTTPPYTPPTPTPSQCNPSTGACSSQGYAMVSCSGTFSGNICQPNSLPCPAGLQGDTYGTACDYSPPKCSTGYSANKISTGSYLCQPTNPPTLSNPTNYSIGQKVGAFTIAAINQYNVTGYYNSPYPIMRPGLGYFTIMHIGDTLNPTCDGSAPLVITAININSITISTGKPSGGSIGGCPICLSGNTLIDTPNGPVNVKELKKGMAVWTKDSLGHRQSAIILKTSKIPVPTTHKMVHVVLEDGRELYASQGHPTADGRFLGELSVGDILDNSQVRSIELVSYNANYTYDILPSGTAGYYWADGILVGSTLK
jgi:hypothetical protein